MPVTRYNSIKQNGNAYVNGDTIIKGPSRLRGMLGYNSGPAQFLLIFDASTVPADGTVPDWYFPIGAAQGFAITFSEMTEFDFGIAWCCSTTLLTKTAGAANIALSANYGAKTQQ